MDGGNLLTVSTGSAQTSPVLVFLVGAIVGGFVIWLWGRRR